MQALSEREALLERRVSSLGESTLWDTLTLAQKFAAGSLTQFGYKLEFIRDAEINKLAILLCNGIPATISREGMINTSPDIIIRP